MIAINKQQCFQRERFPQVQSVLLLTGLWTSPNLILTVLYYIMDVFNTLYTMPQCVQYACTVYSKLPDYGGKYIPTTIKLLTKCPDLWKTSESFRNKIWVKVNARLSGGKLSESI